MTEINCQALVAGAGPAGLAVAGLLARSGFDVVCVAPPSGPDPRTTALMAPALNLLVGLGVWTPQLRAECAPLRHLHMVDDTAHYFSAPTLRFSAAEANLEAFGWNVPLTALVPALRRACVETGVRFIESSVDKCAISDTAVTAHLANGQQVLASFAVGADGRHSRLRAAAGIAVETWQLDQSALVTQFSHSRSHENISTEWHKQGGPFTTVPLPGRRSALVWMGKPSRLETITGFTSADLAKAIQLENHGALGLVSEVGAPRVFAMEGVKAQRFAANRVFLVGEAAHVFAPIGAQGLNMSLRDAGHVLDVVSAHSDGGSADATHRYHHLRLPDVLPRQAAITLVNHSLMSELVPMHLLRAAGLAGVSSFGPLREFVMQQGLSPARNLPSAMRAP